MRHSSQSITIPIYVTDNVDGGPDARNTAYHASLMPVYNTPQSRTFDAIPVNIQIKDGGIGRLDLAVYSNTTYTLPSKPDQTAVVLTDTEYIIPNRDVTIKSAAVNYTSWFNVQKVITGGLSFTTYDYTSGLYANGVVGQSYPAIAPSIVDPFIGSTSLDFKTGQLEIKIDRGVIVNGSDLVASFAIVEVPLNDDGTPAKPGKQVIIR